MCCGDQLNPPPKAVGKPFAEENSQNSCLGLSRSYLCTMRAILALAILVALLYFGFKYFITPPYGPDVEDRFIEHQQIHPIHDVGWSSWSS